MKIGARFLAVAVLLIWVVGVSAQDDEVIRVDTELVEVPLSVTDGAGRPVLSVKQGDISIFEDGRKQEIAVFSATTAPFEVALLLDTSGSTRNELQVIRRAAQHFIDSLRPGDRVAIIAFRSDVVDNRSEAVPEVLTRLTGDRNTLRDALSRVSTSNGTPYYDGLIKVTEDVFREPASGDFRGRRALVALTDGVDSTSISGFDEARELLEETGAAAYFINVNTREFFENNLLGDCEGAMRFSQAQIRRYYAKLPSGVERTSDFCKLGDFERLAISKQLYAMAENEMTLLSQRLGGRVFPAADLSEARGAFRQVAEEIGTKYTIGYYSLNDARDGKFRAIKVDIKGLPKGAQIRAREGYTAPGN